MTNQVKTLPAIESLSQLALGFLVATLQLCGRDGNQLAKSLAEHLETVFNQRRDKKGAPAGAVQRISALANKSNDDHDVDEVAMLFTAVAAAMTRERDYRSKKFCTAIAAHLYDVTSAKSLGHA